MSFLDRLLHPSIRNWIARITLLIGSVGPGSALLLDSKKWGNSPVFQQLGTLPIPLWVFGLVLLIASALILSRKTRDIGYGIVAMFYFTLNISGGFAIANGRAYSALIFSLPVLLWLYLESSLVAARAQVGIERLPLTDESSMGTTVRED